MNNVVFKEGDMELVVGDSFVLHTPTEDEGFYNSFVGEKFTAGICDEIVLTVCQKESLEVYFECRMFKDGVTVKDVDYYTDDGDGWGDDIWTQDAPFMFAIYLVRKGAVKTNDVNNSLTFAAN